MFIKDLDLHAGMLFEFSDGQPVTMWMKNTYISLDLLFIGADNRINYIAASAVPESLSLISSNMPTRAVLELKGGACQQLGIHVGDRIIRGKSPKP